MSFSIPLTSAVTSGDEKAVSASLANGADVNERTNGGQTALILAVIFGHTNIVRQLVNSGADPYERDNLGLNALDWAQRRGSTEALELFKTARPSTPPKRILINLDEPDKPEPEVIPPVRDDEPRESVSEAEKSRRWITGFKQRLDEQAQRRLNSNEPPPSPEPVVPEPEPVRAEAPPPPPEPVRTQTTRILTPEPVVPTGKRKRCPKCNTIYNGDLLSYCSYDEVPLVDIDQPIITEEPPKSNRTLFWAMVVATLIGSIAVGSLITAYVYKSNQATAAQRTVVKGQPELGGDLVGKAVSLPDAECPVRGSETVAGTVTVYIIVAKNGQVYKARGLGGDWLMRGAATEAAMKSTFDPEKLIDRETEGTITYTFKP
ncbi:MAG TPA: ankyrin repeat domain-containing protein [Pyrinomonadaceae bacterium]